MLVQLIQLEVVEFHLSTPLSEDVTGSVKYGKHMVHYVSHLDSIEHNLSRDGSSPLYNLLHSLPSIKVISITAAINLAWILCNNLHSCCCGT